MAQAPKAVLLIGGNGVLGTHLAFRLRREYRVISAALEGKSVPVDDTLSVRLNLRDESFIKSLVFRVAPEFVIYLGGPHVTAWAEKEPKVAELYHANGIGEILKSTELTHSKFIYISSCHIFDGHRGNYRETDTISPHLNLGKFKASGENFVRSRASSYAMLRLPPLHGPGHPSRPTFLDVLHQRALEGQPTELQDYELYNFASLSDTADAIATMLAQGVRKGTYHYGGLTRLTHYQLGLLYAQSRGLNEKLISAIERPYAKSAVDRKHPLDFSLNCTEIIKTYSVQTREIEESLAGLSFGEFPGVEPSVG